MHSKKLTQKKLICTYEAVFCSTLCFTLNGVLDLQQRRDFDVGEVTWFCPKVSGISSFFKQLAYIVKKKEKGFDLLITS